MTQLIPAWIDDVLQPVEKLEVHRRGLKHPAISVFVMDGNRTLLQRRALCKYHTPGLWANACCTHPHWGEDPEVCAKRRLREELGIENLSLSQREGVEYRAEVGADLIEHEVVDMFVGEGCPSLAPNPAEVLETRWTTLDALRQEMDQRPEIFTPWLRIYVAEHTATIFGEAA